MRRHLAMRTVLIHCHLFKNAGSTLDWSLRRYFGDRFVEHTDDAQMWTSPAYLGWYLSKNEDLCAVSSHHVPFPMPVLEGVRLLPVVMLRHPIDRVGSVYTFEVKQEASGPGAVNAKKMTFPQYVRWRMEPTAGATIRNFQTRRCCGRRFKVGDHVTEQDFEVARRRLQSMPLMGLVDRYEESMVLFEHVLQPVYPDINLAYVKQNVAEGRRGTLEERVQHVCDRLGSEVSAILIEENKWDLALYEEAKTLMSKRVGAIPEFDKNFTKFRKRCRRRRIISTGKGYIVKGWTGIKGSLYQESNDGRFT